MKKEVMALQVGDKVRVRKDLADFSEDVLFAMADGTREVAINDSMKKLAGEIVEIDGLDYEGRYHIAEDNGVWHWTDELFEYVKEKQTPEVVTGHMPLTYGLNIIKIIYQNPATIIFYKNMDGKVRKSVAKCNVEDGDVYDKDRGLEVASLKAIVRESKKMLNKY